MQDETKAKSKQEDEPPRAEGASTGKRLSICLSAAKSVLAVVPTKEHSLSLRFLGLPVWLFGRPAGGGRLWQLCF